MGSSEGEPKHTLFEFIDQNYKLVTATGVFVALTVFSTQIDQNSSVKIIFPALTLAAAALLLLELGSRVPDHPRHWRLQLFEMVLALLGLVVAYYWLSRFPQVWVECLFVVLIFVVLLGPALLVSVAVRKVLLTVAKHKPAVSEKLADRVAGIVFLIVVAATALSFPLLSKWLSAHPVSIHIPESLKNIF
jgi:hypothetical protein